MKIGADFGPLLQARDRSRFCRRVERTVHVAMNDARQAWAHFRDDLRTVRTMLATPAPDPKLSDLLRLMVEDCSIDGREDRRSFYIARRRAYLRKGAQA